MIENARRVGVVTKTHGLKGALKVYPTTDNPKRLAVSKTVYFDTKEGPVEAKIKSVSPFKNIFIIAFEEFSDINEVERFKGVDIFMEDEPDSLKEGEYYVDDLIGLSVEDEDGTPLGTLTEVIVTGANDVYAVSDSEREILVPAIKDCILDVSIDEGRMKVHLLPGLV